MDKFCFHFCPAIGTNSFRLSTEFWIEEVQNWYEYSEWKRRRKKMNFFFHLHRLFNDCSLFHILLYNKRPVIEENPLSILPILIAFVHWKRFVWTFNKKFAFYFHNFYHLKINFCKIFGCHSLIYYIHSPAINQKKICITTFHYLAVAKLNVIRSTINLCHWIGYLCHYNLSPKLSRTIAFFTKKNCFFQYPKWHQSKQQPISSHHHRIKLFRHNTFA